MKIVNGVLVPDNQLKRVNEVKFLRDRTINIARVTNHTKSKLASLPASTASFSILILRRLGGVGDVIMTTPCLRGLKEKFPNCKITYATNKEYFQGALFDILKCNPYIDELKEVSQVTEKSFDFAVDLTAVDIQREQGDRAPPHRIEIYCETVGVNPSSRVPVYTQLEEEYDFARQELETFFPNLKNLKLVFINPASNTPRRDVPAPSIQQVINILSSKSDIGVVLGHHFDHGLKHPRLFKAIGRNIRQIISLMDNCDLIIAHDTSLLHLAGALEKRIVGLFGSIYPPSRLTHYANAIPIWKKESCPQAPCWYANCSQTPQFKCMKSITPEEIARTSLLHLQTKETRLQSRRFDTICGELL